MQRNKIVFIGGGSVNWSPNIGRDILLTPELADSEIVLLDINKTAAQLVKKFLDKLAKKIGVHPQITVSDQREALKGAKYILITISTGGLDAMAHDLAIPQKYGILHTVGDTSGPGGWARAIRNFDIFTSLANDINRYAPGAMVLNYTNPMTTLTDVLSRICHGPVIGLCHGLFEDIEFLKRFYKHKDESQIHLHYAGLNHFFWVTRAMAGDIDVIKDLSHRLKTKSLSQLTRQVYPEQPAKDTPREVADELFRLTGVLPYMGDRHVCEFFSQYITNPHTLRRYKLVRTTIAQRREMFRKAWLRAEKMVAGEISPQYLKRTRETAADIILAHSQGRTFIDVGNVPNIGQISNLPRGLVVETAVRIDRTGITPLAFGDLPSTILGFVQPYAQVFRMTVDACFEHDKKMAIQALRLDPVCSHLDGKSVTELGERLLHAHRQFITAF